eukprot:m.233773 g.233773  ORF g.233773 m.233773 type:complete len:538 (+) comp15742_c0_seq2:428-2041(+)
MCHIASTNILLRSPCVDSEACLGLSLVLLLSLLNPRSLCRSGKSPNWSSTLALGEQRAEEQLSKSELKVKELKNQLEALKANSAAARASALPVFTARDPATRKKPPLAAVVASNFKDRNSMTLGATSHLCSGRDFSGSASSASRAHCHFRQMCIAPGKGPPPPHVSTRGHYDWYYLYNTQAPQFHNYPDELDFSLGVGPHHGHPRLAIKPKVLSVTEFSERFPKIRKEATVTYIYYEFNGQNFGHMLTDILMPAYGAMAGFDKLDYDVQLVRFQITHDIPYSCDFQRNPGYGTPGWKPGAITSEKNDKLCKLFYRMLVPSISSRPVLVLGDLFNKTQTPVCFDDLLVGSPALSDECTEKKHGRNLSQVSHCNTGRMEQFWAFRCYTKANLGVEDVPPTKHHVVVWKRSDKKRALNNLDEACDLIRETLNVKVTVIDWATIPIADQLRLIGSATVHITGPGGGSFIAIYLPRGSTSVRLYSKDFGMEFHFFNFLGYLHPVYREARANLINTSELVDDVKLGMQRYEHFNPTLFKNSRN